MRTRLRVGIEVQCVAPLPLLRAELGFARLLRLDSVFFPDHYLGFVPSSVWTPAHTPAARHVPSPHAYYDPYVSMGAAARSLGRRARIGTGVTEPLRRHPATLAQAFVTLDHLTKGRAILGLGNGERENTEPYGIPFDYRVGRLEEALRIVRLLWESRGEPVDFEGRFWRLRHAIFATPLYQGRPPALWLAAHAPRMLALTGRYADGWYPTAKMSPAEYNSRLAAIRAAATEAGRSFSGFEPALQIQLILGPSRKAVLTELASSRVAAATAMLLPGPLWTRHGLRHPLGDDFEGFPAFVPQEIDEGTIDAAARQVTPALFGDGVFAGSPAEVADEIHPYLHAGLAHVVIWNVGPLVRGVRVDDLLRLAVLVHRLHRLPLGQPPAATEIPTSEQPGRPAAAAVDTTGARV